LLGAGQNGAVELLDKLGGLAAVGAAIASVGALDLFAVRDELVSWGNLIARSLRERLRDEGGR
jgi:hypothetical protein